MPPPPPRVRGVPAVSTVGGRFLFHPVGFGASDGAHFLASSAGLARRRARRVRRPRRVARAWPRRSWDPAAVGVRVVSVAVVLLGEVVVEPLAVVGLGWEVPKVVAAWLFCRPTIPTTTLRLLRQLRLRHLRAKLLQVRGRLSCRLRGRGGDCFCVSRCCWPRRRRFVFVRSPCCQVCLQYFFAAQATCAPRPQRR